MVNLFINIIEDLLLVYFISYYIKVDHRRDFQICMFLVCLIETCIFDFLGDLYLLLSVLILGSLLLGIKYYNKVLCLSDVISCFLALALVLGTNMLALLIMSMLSNISINQISQSSYHFIVSTLLAKMLFFIAVQSILYMASHTKRLFIMQQWWNLIPICFIIFFLMHILIESVVFNQFNIHTIYWFLALVLLLSIFFTVLLYQIHKEDERKRINELNNSSFALKKVQ